MPWERCITLWFAVSMAGPFLRPGAFRGEAGYGVNRDRNPVFCLGADEDPCAFAAENWPSFLIMGHAEAFDQLRDALQPTPSAPRASFFSRCGVGPRLTIQWMKEYC